MSKIFGIHSRLTELPASPEAPASAQNNTPAIEILTPAEAASNAYLQEHNFMNLKYSQEIHFSVIKSYFHITPPDIYTGMKSEPSCSSLLLLLSIL